MNAVSALSATWWCHFSSADHNDFIFTVFMKDVCKQHDKSRLWFNTIYKQTNQSATSSTGFQPDVESGHVISDVDRSALLAAGKCLTSEYRLPERCTLGKWAMWCHLSVLLMAPSSLACSHSVTSDIVFAAGEYWKRSRHIRHSLAKSPDKTKF